MSLAALLMLQVQMSAAHEGKLMKESSLQTQSSITAKDLHAVYGIIMNRDGRNNSHQSHIESPKLVHCMARLVCVWKVYCYKSTLPVCL